jgi:hypothetical protein
VEDGGIVAYGGKLDIRPPYQREFVYKDKQRDAVIESVLKNYPLNVMYWVVNGNGYEMLDGQQRTISICQYVKGEFTIITSSGAPQFFSGLTDDKQEEILHYKLMIYFCEGTDSEKLDWFKTINIAGEKLTEQESRNAIYTGSWLADAKLKFSKTNCAAYAHGKDYVEGAPIRQAYLETAISWINEGNIVEYMATNQHAKNAEELWQYFHNVIQWVKTTFTTYRKEMKGLPWGIFYNTYKDNTYDVAALEKRIIELIDDDDVTLQKGIYEYLLSGESKDKERCLSLRSFSDKDKRKVFERQKGICTRCEKQFDMEKMEADHITPWHKGGKTVIENCQMLCKDCNQRKAGK